MKLNVIFSLLLLICISCSQSDPVEPMDIEPVQSSAKEITSLEIVFKTRSGNTTVEPGRISGTSIEIFVPSYLDLSGVEVNISSSAKSALSMNGSTINNSSNLDLNEPATILVTAEDNSTKEYFLQTKNFDQPFRDAVEAFRTKWGLVGMSFAITYQERLIFADGFGMADVEKNVAADQNTSYRLASVSKAITGVTVMKMVEDGLLDLDTPVFGPGGVLEELNVFSSEYHSITMKHLVSHTAGLPTNNADDPAFRFSNDLSLEEVIRQVVESTALQSSPGTEYSYSNFAFMVASLVIEKVSGESLDKYLQKIMAEIDIEGIRETSNDPNNLKIGEGKSYDDVFNPYAINLNRIKGAGGLIASAKDLVKLMAHIDESPGKADFLTSSSIELLTTPIFNSYGLGWGTDGGSNNWHVGSVQGSFANIVLNKATGISFALISNTTNGQNYNQEFFDLPAMVTNGISVWPEYDLF